MTQQLQDLEVYTLHAGKHARVIWNPHAEVWYVYLDVNTDVANFAVDRLELHTVGYYGGLKPKYAPEGSPSFVGTIAAHPLITKPTRAEYKRLFAHPSAPGVVLFDDADQKHFDHCRRLLLEGPSMWADPRRNYNQ